MEVERYHEPFSGGLSVFFHVASTSKSLKTAFLGDVNLRVIRTYEEVKNDPFAVIDQLRQLEAGYNAAADKATFYNELREQHNRVFPRADAARFIFLMNAAWNGVFRINQAGKFNVPHGNPKGRLRLPSEEELLAVSQALKVAKLRAQSWESSINEMRKGDFVFFDPPYFRDEDRKDLYERNRLFTFRDQLKLADTLVDLKQRGVDFILTNSAHPRLISMYRERGLHIEEIGAHRSISSKGEGRGREGELVVTPGSDRSNDRLLRAKLRLIVGDI